MFKKILAISLTFLVALFISSTVFANSENVMENGKNAINTPSIAIATAAIINIVLNADMVLTDIRITNTL